MWVYERRATHTRYNVMLSSILAPLRHSIWELCTTTVYTHTVHISFDANGFLSCIFSYMHSTGTHDPMRETRGARSPVHSRHPYEWVHAMRYDSCAVNTADLYISCQRYREKYTQSSRLLENSYTHGTASSSPSERLHRLLYMLRKNEENKKKKSGPPKA